MNLGDLNFFSTCHGGISYSAEIRKVCSDLWALSVFIFQDGKRWPEFERRYTTPKAALNRLIHYWKGETAHWNRL